MMAATNTNPVEYRAVVACSCAGSHFAAGDVVPPGTALAALLRHGERFVTASKPTKKTPTPTTASTPDKEAD